MNEGMHRLNAAMSKSLIAMALCLQLPLAAPADDGGGLKPETPSTDSAQPSKQETSPPAPAQPSQQETSPPAPATRMLYGKARKKDSLDGPDSTGAPNNPTHELNATDDAASLQSEQAAADKARMYQLVSQKLATGAQLTSDEYRSLGYGCVGYESDQTYYQSIAKVTKVYADSPAEKAGIRKGDKILEGGNNPPPEDRTKESYKVTCGLAGTPVDVTVLGKGQGRRLTLIRMNIEDIQEPKIRREWEDMVRHLGYPQDGTYTAGSIRDLTGK